jgi:hypothetical protein
MKYPNCRCEKHFGRTGLICGDPGCDQVKDVNKSLNALIGKFAHLIPENPEPFVLPDNRSRPKR